MALIWDKNRKLHTLKNQAKTFDIDMSKYSIISSTAEADIKTSIDNSLATINIEKEFAVHFLSKQPISYIICVYPKGKKLPEKWWLDNIEEF